MKTSRHVCLIVVLLAWAPGSGAQQAEYVQARIAVQDLKRLSLKAHNPEFFTRTQAFAAARRLPALRSVWRF
jgi:hypothetical protein